MTQQILQFRHRYLSIDDIDIHYMEAGFADPSRAAGASRPTPPAASDLNNMLLLHGIGMDWRVWQAISKRLAPYFRLYMPDLRGHGLSGKPECGYSLAHYASDIELMLQALDLQEVTLVGSSLGAMIAVVIEMDANVVVRRVLIDPPLRRGAGPTRPLFERILTIKTGGHSQEDQERAIFDVLKGENPKGGRLYLKYMAETWAATAPGVLREALAPVESQAEVEAALQAIEVPTLIMRGNPSLGSVLRAEDAGRATDLLPNGEVQYFQGAGHAIHGSQPREFLDAILRFANISVLQDVNP